MASGSSPWAYESPSSSIVGLIIIIIKVGCFERRGRKKGQKGCESRASDTRLVPLRLAVRGSNMDACAPERAVAAWHTVKADPETRGANSSPRLVLFKLLRSSRDSLKRGRSADASLLRRHCGRASRRLWRAREVADDAYAVHELKEKGAEQGPAVLGRHCSAVVAGCVV